jgi:hypothetical protein
MLFGLSREGERVSDLTLCAKLCEGDDLPLGIVSVHVS